MDGDGSLVVCSDEVRNRAVAEMVQSLLRQSVRFSSVRALLYVWMKERGHFLLSCDRMEIPVKLRPEHQYVSRVVILYYPRDDPQFAAVVQVQESPRYTKTHPISTW